MITGYLPGTFDLFHIGHLNLIKRAKEHCDRLIVGVNTCEICYENKHKRPIIPLDERCQIVEAVRYVDLVVIQDTTDRYDAWERYKFDVIFVGDDWKGTDKWNRLEVALGEVGAKVEYFPYTKGTSSTILRDVLSSILSGT